MHVCSAMCTQICSCFWNVSHLALPNLPASGQILLHSCDSRRQAVLQTCCAPCLQVALIVVMAQIGSFVPAQYASIRLVEKVFTRIGTQDSIEDNSSSFLVRAVGCTSGLQQMSGAHLLLSLQFWAGLCTGGGCSPSLWRSLQQMLGTVMLAGACMQQMLTSPCQNRPCVRAVLIGTCEFAQAGKLSSVG